MQSSEESESDPELREPQAKRRRTTKIYKQLSGGDVDSETDAHLRSEEDTIPFAEEEYESIETEVMSDPRKEVCEDGAHTESHESILSSSVAAAGTKSDTEQHPDIGYSSGENSNSVHENITDTE
ncbi:unnamed protein product [Gongylonema pulchrum]|uniref:Uncharacterized protein n=1 Tax=Gongylonema pulchrum TaxID=637853 RepID=A0A3P7NZU7_9BILA|nr:unnamed protein product [Gongylonema pulchrum]